jgi:hypothetical protein
MQDSAEKIVKLSDELASIREDIASQRNMVNDQFEKMQGMLSLVLPRQQSATGPYFPLLMMSDV